jgi:thymidylate synthase (FAD)
MIDHKHWSPFEMAHAVFEISTSRAIAAQILRHRSFSFQEFSQRYAAPTGIEIYKARRQAEKNRQSSIDDLPQEDADWFDIEQQRLNEHTQRLYNEATRRGIAKESARFLLPLSTSTKLYMSGTLRSWIHYVELRCQEDVQQEHREIALIIRDFLSANLPHISEAMGWSE